MEPRERLSAHNCLKRGKTDLLSNDTLGIGGTTPTEETALLNNDTLGIGETMLTEETALLSNDTLGIAGTTRTEELALRIQIADKEGSITAIAEAIRSQEPTHTSETILQKTALQDDVAKDNGSPSHQDEGVLQGQEPSNLDDDGSLESVLGEKDGKSDEQSARYPITDG
ncbi:hypothetical protein MMC31_001138 [Peltigera leucophlebia]|nr:hypothetical protein [Peltigera leucophlebia]